MDKRLVVGIALALMALLIAGCGTSATATPRSTPTARISGVATEAADLIPRTTPTPTSRPSYTPTSRPTNTRAPTAVPAATITPSASANTAANLRSGPGTNYPIIGSAQSGETLRITARNPAGDWLQLASGAWIAANLVDHAPAVPLAITIPPTPAPTQTPVPPTATPAIVTQPTAAPPPARACCKHCGSNSQPCGDTCISLSKTCHVGVGCA
jgi:hypothetical protein